jgi:sarcosine oxidase subunit gamma
MPELLVDLPLAGLDVTVGAARLSEVPMVAALWLFAPYPGQDAAAAEVLGARLPDPGRTARAGDVEIRWAGRAQTLLIGPEEWRPVEGLAAHGALTDVSDVHARMTLSGLAAPDILARLVPLDLRPARFPPGATAKTMLGHMTAQITALPDGVEIMVMRSYARSAAHEVEIAMRRVAARP